MSTPSPCEGFSPHHLGRSAAWFLVDERTHRIAQGAGGRKKLFESEAEAREWARENGGERAEREKISKS